MFTPNFEGSRSTLPNDLPFPSSFIDLITRPAGRRDLMLYHVENGLFGLLALIQRDPNAYTALIYACFTGGSITNPKLKEILNSIRAPQFGFTSGFIFFERVYVAATPPDKVAAVLNDRTYPSYPIMQAVTGDNLNKNIVLLVQALYSERGKNTNPLTAQIKYPFVQENVKLRIITSETRNTVDAKEILGEIQALQKEAAKAEVSARSKFEHRLA